MRKRCGSGWLFKSALLGTLGAVIYKLHEITNALSSLMGG